MKKASAFILCLVMFLLGTGFAQALHEAEHAREDAAALGAARAAGHPLPDPPVHDDSNCSTHAQLHTPYLSGTWVQLLVFLGLFVAFLTELAVPFISSRFRLDLQCRGPPLAV